MSKFRNNIMLAKSLLANRQMIRVSPAINLFLARYMGKFKLMNVDGQLILHSHLPPVNSLAFTRFIDEQLLARTPGPSHAQIALTDECPQQCLYCYNKNRKGQRMTTAEIKRTIADLRDSGVIWLGLTGGEPLLNPDIVEIIASAGSSCAIKLFTTGFGLTRELALALQKAGLFSACVSLDHWQVDVHDQIRGYPGAYRIALEAIEIFRQTPGIHTSVSTVVSREMIHDGQLAVFIEFLRDLGIHEVWLSEAKPTVADFQKEELVITESERLELVRLQDRFNRQGKLTINYLGHFEGSEHFGCNAGNKMVYVDAFGEVSPCVFLPMTFGNIREKPMQDLLSDMRSQFASQGGCFINKHYALVGKYRQSPAPISRAETLALMKEVQAGPPATFSRLYYKHKG